MNTNIIKVITGIRRCGKSTLLIQIIDKLKSEGVKDENIIYINFESIKFQNINLNKYVSTKITNKEKKSIIFYLMKFKIFKIGRK